MLCCKQVCRERRDSVCRNNAKTCLLDSVNELKHLGIQHIILGDNNIKNRNSRERAVFYL